MIQNLIPLLTAAAHVAKEFSDHDIHQRVQLSDDDVEAIAKAVVRRLMRETNKKQAPVRRSKALKASK